MKATLALPAYNEEAVIEREVREAAYHLSSAFTSGAWELLVVNAGSRNATATICNDLSKVRFRVFMSTQ